MLGGQVRLNICLQVDVVDPVVPSPVLQPVRQVVAALYLAPGHCAKLVSLLAGEGSQSGGFACSDDRDEGLERAFNVMGLTFEVRVGDFDAVGIRLGGGVEGLDGVGEVIEILGEFPDHVIVINLDYKVGFKRNRSVKQKCRSFIELSPPRHRLSLKGSFAGREGTN